MNFLAKHFFEYQSFINLPHTAVQMHKCPPSQAGTDPSAAWAPKDLHVAGKNQAAPAARANRNYHGDQRTGSHRHGRPSKLEFRNWGERHGELREEKIVPHKDHWMESLEGHHHHGGSLDAADVPVGMPMAAIGSDHHFPSDYFPRAKRQPPPARQHSLDASLVPSVAGKTAPTLRVLLILTVTPHLDFVSVTVKAIKGLAAGVKDPLVQLRLFDGNRLLEERGPQKTASRGDHLPSIQVDSAETSDAEERQLGQSFLLKAPSPLRLPFCRMTINLYSFPNVPARALSEHQGQPQLLGTCIVGPSGTVTRGNSHWRQMVKKMGVPVAMWHDLVLTTKPQTQVRQLGKSPPREPPRARSNTGPTAAGGKNEKSNNEVNEDGVDVGKKEGSPRKEAPVEVKKKSLVLAK